jgi:hypothetical protein
MARSIAAVILGYAVWTVLWLGGNAALAAARPLPPNPAPITDAVLLGSLLALSVLCSLVAGLTAAALGRRSTIAPTVLGGLLLLTGIGVQMSVWQRMPLWYHLPFLALLIPVCLLGGRFPKASPRAAISPTPA